MLENKRKTRLYAFSSIVCLQASPPGQTLRAQRNWSVSALEKLENQEVSCAFLPAHRPIALRRMDEINGS